MNATLASLLLQSVLNEFQGGKKRENKILLLAMCLNRKTLRAVCPFSFGHLHCYVLAELLLPQKNDTQLLVV